MTDARLVCPECGNKSETWNMPLHHDTVSDKWHYRCTCGWESPHTTYSKVDCAARMAIFKRKAPEYLATLKEAG